MGKWTCRAFTKRLRLGRAKAFFAFTVERGWAARSPLAKLRPARSDSLAVVEVRALLKAAANEPKERGLILLVHCSGTAIGDSVTLCGEELVGTELTLRRAKSGELVMVDLPQLVLRALRRLRGPSPDYLWRSGQSRAVTTVKYSRSRLREAALRAGATEFRPHRLRDAFAVAPLTAGVAIEEVSALLGQSSIRPTERNCTPWAGAGGPGSRRSCARPIGWTRRWRKWTLWAARRDSTRS